MSFLDIALACAAEGWYVFPCIPKGKQPLTKHGFKDATTDEKQIREWWARYPDANIGIACGKSGICVMDIDYGPADRFEWLAWMTKHDLRNTYSVRTGRRPGFGVQVYYKGTRPDVGLFELDGFKGQIKSLGGYVMAAGCIHPSGERYEALDLSGLEPIPEIVATLQTKKLAVVDGVMEKIPEGAGRHAALMSVAGKLRASGLDEPAILAALIPLNESMCEVPVPFDDLEHLAESAGKFELPKPEPEIIIGKPKSEVEVLEDADEVPAEVRPVYPDEIWDGTVYGEFAEMCTRDNSIPKKLFIETFRTIAGALMGDRVQGSVKDISARLFTVLIAPPGRGKGTAFSMALDFFTTFWTAANGEMPPLLFRDKSPYRNKGIGARVVNPASAPGFMNALQPDTPGKGKTPDPMDAWDPIPRVITIQEEIRSLFANFELESTGAGLESMLCELFDRTAFTTTATAQRKQASGEAMFSLLGAITADGWASVFAKAASVESGFLSRVNLIATEGQFALTAGLDPVDFTKLRSAFLPRIMDLENSVCYIRATPAAKDTMTDWFASIDPEQDKTYLRTRINIHAWKVALHLAWLQRSEYMDNSHVIAGIKAANYQMKMREFYAPAPGDTRQARCEASIRKVLTAVRKIRKRELQQKTNANRVGVTTWEKCLQAMEAAGELRVTKDRPAVVILLKRKD